MKKVFIVVFLLGVLSACVQWFPARAQELEPGVFEVSAMGNSFSSLKSLKNKVDKKSLALCEQKAIEAISQEAVAQETNVQESGAQAASSHNLSSKLIPRKIKIDKYESHTDDIYIDGRTQSASYFSYTQTIECVPAN